MRVLQINTVYKGGGSTGRIVYDLRSIQHKSGIDDFVAYGEETVCHADDRTLMMQPLWERKLSILQCRIWPRHGLYNVPATKRLLRWIDEVKPDIIHLHNIHNSYVNVKMLFEYIKQHDIAVVWTLHDCWSFTGWCAYFDYAKCDKWKSHCRQCPNKHDYPFTWFFDLSKSNFERKREIFCGVNNLTLVTPSQWLADLTKESFLKNYQVKVINNGIDLKVFNKKDDAKDVREKYGVGSRKMILAMAMQMNKRKGIDYLLELRHLINKEECLVLVGVKPEEKETLETDRCICIPRISNVNELASLYSAADVFINPTLEDNFPTTNIEALACGTPVITFRTGGSIESVDENVGLIVEKGDMQGLLTAIRKVVNKGKDYYSDSCRKKAEQNYEKTAQYKKYIELYQYIANES